MSTLDMGVAAGAAIAGLVVILWLRSLLKRRLGGKTGGAGRAPANGADAPLIERRVSAVERAQAEIVGRLDDMAETGAPEERMQAMASSLVGLIQDKNASMETALAGLDQLRARLGTLEKVGDMAEARALFDGMTERLEGLETGRKEIDAAFEARLAALAERLEGDGGPAAALAARLEKLHELKDAGLAAMMARVEPLEKRLGLIETGMKALPDEAAGRVEGRIGEIARLQSDVQAEVAALKARADSATASFAEISDQLTRLYAQKDSTTETMLARLSPLEAKLAELETGLREADPRAALDRFAERLAASEAAHGADHARLSGEIETLKSAENPFGEISDQLTRLYAQKDAVVEAMLARLSPLEAKLAELEAGLREADPRAALDRFAERLAASEAAHGADHARLTGEIETLKSAENPFGEISDQLTRLYAQKDSTTEAMLARLVPLEAKLAELETGLREADPRAALDRFAERLAASEAAHRADHARLTGEIETLKSAENPFAEISDQLTRLYAQKDSTVETMLARLSPLEAKLAELEAGLREADPRAALDRFAERLAASEAAHGADHARLTGEIETLKSAENPFAEISEQLTRLYAQKDSTTETMLARLSPLEAKLAELETGLREADPRAALDRFAERLAESEARLTGEIETLKSAENPFAEISEQLTRLYAQKDSTTETMLARLSPLEAKLAELETGLREADPRAALDRFAERLAESEARLTGEIETLKSAENPFAEISEQLTRLYAQKDSTTETMLARLSPLEAKLAELETGLREADPRAALDRFAERLAASEAAHGADHARLSGEIETLKSAENPFGEISDQLTRLYAQKDAVVEAMLARLAPVEAKLTEMEKNVAASDPQAAIERFAERLAASEARLSSEIETLKSAENPFAEISDQLTRLYAQKDGTVAAMLARLAPLETKLAGIETEMGARDPQAAIAGLAERIERLQDGQGDLAERLAAASEAAAEPHRELAERVAGLAARADAASEEIASRIAPLTERLEALETRGLEDEDAARAEAEEIAEQLIAMREAAERTALFADRIAMLETSLPRLTMAQSLMMEALERRSADGRDAAAAEGPAAPPEVAETAPDAAPGAPVAPEAGSGDGAETGTVEEADEIWDIPRVVSMHQG